MTSKSTSWYHIACRMGQQEAHFPAIFMVTDIEKKLVNGVRVPSNKGDILAIPFPSPICLKIFPFSFILTSMEEFIDWNFVAIPSRRKRGLFFLFFRLDCYWVLFYDWVTSSVFLSPKSHKWRQPYKDNIDLIWFIDSEANIKHGIDKSD